MKTVFSSFNSAEAQLVWSRLDAAGFPAEVANEITSMTMEGYSLAAGGILVQVPDDREAEALLFLKDQGPGLDPGNDEETASRDRD